MSAEPTESVAVTRARTGDADALTDIYRRHGQEMLDVAYRMTGSGDEAEDVVQDVFVGLPEALRSFDGSTGGLSPWLRRLTVRTALLRMRREKRRSRWQRRAAELGRDHERPVAVEARLTLERALARMPPDFRAVYVLKEVEGYSHADIAEVLGITTAASEVRLHRARKYLKDRLKGKL